MKDGGPAFPVTQSQSCPSCHIGMIQHDTGMTLRDWFAGNAMKGIVISERIDGGNLLGSKIAKTAYRLADAMIAEREKGEGK